MRQKDQHGGPVSSSNNTATAPQVVLPPRGGAGVPTTFYEFTTDRGVPYEEAMRIYNKEVGPTMGNQG